MVDSGLVVSWKVVKDKVNKAEQGLNNEVEKSGEGASKESMRGVEGPEVYVRLKNRYLQRKRNTQKDLSLLPERAVQVTRQCLVRHPRDTLGTKVKSVT